MTAVNRETEALNISVDNETFREIFERSASGIALVDKSGYLKVTNSAVQNMLGYSANELTNMVFTDFTHPDDTEKNWQFHQDLVAGRRDNYKMVKRCIRKTGEVFWASVNVSAVRDDRNKVYSIIAILDDIHEQKTIEKELEKSSAQFRAIFHSLSDASIFVDIHRRIVMINASATKQFGYDFSEVKGQSSKLFYANVGDFEKLGLLHFNTAASVNAKLYEMTYRRKDGSTFIGETQGTKVEDDKGNVIGYIGIIRDISERKKTEQRLRLSQKIFEDTAKLILVMDRDRRIIDVNNAYCLTTGYSPKLLLGSIPNVLKSSQYNKSFYKALWRSLTATGCWKGEIWDRKKNGDLFPTWTTVSVVKDPNGVVSHYVAISSDITSIKENERRLQNLAHFDQLTKLPNRRMFNDSLSKAIASAQRHDEKLAVMYIDLDGFKQVNDILGHTAGDNLLIDVANRLKNCIREEDAISRLGGDEFALVVSKFEGMDFLHVLAKRITRELAISLNYGGRDISVTGSIGVAVFPENGKTEGTLQRHADQAMYFAKQQGKNTYQFFDPKIKASILSRIHLGSDLRSALKNDEFFVLFQPKYDLKSRKVTGFEALIRWQHPKRGVVLPSDFIPFAEESDLIVEIGKKLAERVCLHVKYWQSVGLAPLPVAINISAREFRFESFVNHIQGIIRGANLPANLFELEVTESLLMEDIDNTIYMLHKLKEIGFKISIDDFGTGYSSLSYLKKLPVDTLKIDRSFLADMTDNTDDREIVSAILSMAKSLNLHVIAEGVENIKQLRFLYQNHCHEIQGNLITEPVSFDLVSEKIKSIEATEFAYC